MSVIQAATDNVPLLAGIHQCYNKTLKDYTSVTTCHCLQNSFVWYIMYVYILSIFNKLLQKVPENMWRYLLKRPSVSKLLYANVQTIKATLVRNYFSRSNNFWLPVPSLSHSAIFDQINTDVLFRRVNYLYLSTCMCPIVFLYPVSS